MRGVRRKYYNGVTVDVLCSRQVGVRRKAYGRRRSEWRVGEIDVMHNIFNDATYMYDDD